MLSRSYYRCTTAPGNPFRKSSCYVLLEPSLALPTLQSSRIHSRLNSLFPSSNRQASTSQVSRRPPSSKLSQSSSISATSPISNPQQALSSISLRETLNPPDSTLPTPLDAVTRDSSTSTFSYYYQLGRSYARFYKTGVQNTWINYKAARAVSQRTKHSDYNSSQVLTRSERLLLKRSSHDIRRIPFFALLFVLCGEWLPLIVPFMPRTVPLTCRIPKQEEGMRKRQSERRRRALQAMGNPEWLDVLGQVLRSSSLPQESRSLLPLCRMLSLYSAKIDWLLDALPFVPMAILRGRLNRHLSFLRTDDRELLEMRKRAGGLRMVAEALSEEERARACEDRGLDVCEKREGEIKEMLVDYLSNVAPRSQKT